MPEHSEGIIAINVNTGEFVLGKDVREASEAFDKRWPEGGFYICRVYGSLAIRM